MKVNYLNLIVLILLGFSSCQEEKKESSNITVLLETKSDNNPVGIAIKPFQFLDSIPKELNGIINRDSSFVGYINTINPKDLSKWYELEDNARYSDINTRILCLSGYNNGKQFFILDLNANRDFGDDKTVAFDIGLKYRTHHDPILKDSFPEMKMKINKLDHAGIYEDVTYFNIYPDPNYFTYRDQNPPVKEKFKRDLLIAAKFNDYFYGTFSISDKPYKIAVSKDNIRGPRIVIREIDSAFHELNNSRRQEYKLLDTLMISKTYFQIDELSFEPTKINLKRLQLEEDLEGFRIGNITHNFKIEDLEGNSSNLKNLLKGKKLILLDFWGTWCVPCRKLTPHLVALHGRYGEKVSFASLAFEEDLEPVLDYTLATGMDWYNGIIKGNPKSRKNSPRIISELRVEAFPTFILLDPNLKIVYRGHGGNYKEMVGFLDDYFKNDFKNL
jgi:thiol-disulfide isomerase/thioredoxin